MRLVFMGTPEFAVPTLDALVATGHQIVAVYTQPDRPKGRGQKLGMPPVKEAALRFGLPVHQPERIKAPEVVAELQTMAPEVMVVVGYGQIIPQSILDIPANGILNVHASLLPKYRGAAPIQWAIANGEQTTGITIMKIDAGLDTGDMLSKRSVEVQGHSAISLGPILAREGAELLVETLTRLSSIVPERQDHAQSTYAPILKKEDGHIHWNTTSREILNRIKGLQPWPGCYGFLRGQRFHIWDARLRDQELQPGCLAKTVSGLAVGCGQGALELLEVQLEGKKRMQASAFLNGFSLEQGEALA